MLSALTAVVATATTLAWFIGMRTVNVSSFDVEIATTDSLLISLDGDTWDTTLSISEDTLDAVSYVGHTNSWGGEGLVPVSSIGSMDATVSRMILYEKASLTASPGGYRLMAARADNTGASEHDGYVAFDLFIKNFSGTQYIEALEPLDEEAIYLTTDSAVTVAVDGVANTGIENSVRVAFGQVGRVIATQTDDTIITGITCTDDEVNDVTGICRTAQIWEPNDTDHVANAISWYETSCIARKASPDGDDVTDPASFTGVCGTVTDGTAYDTYAVATAIASSDNVDVYDGADYNSFTGSSALLNAYDCFTDTEKDLTGVDRPTFMTLAPNSITKVRVYIYIEGQDIDNYDFASIGKKISVNFGLTKERFTETDINYTENGGPELNNPSITLVGDDPYVIANGSEYTDPGATAWDSLDGDITSDIVVGGDTVNTAVNGDYVVTYDVTDSDDNAATQVTRTVTVQ